MKISWVKYYEAVRDATLAVTKTELVTVIGVTGGRDFLHWDMVRGTFSTINDMTPVRTIINGGARGLDRHAAYWGSLHFKTVRTLPARWKRDDKAAGPLRNSDMVEILLGHGPEAALVSFPGGSGTADMTAKCNLAGIKVIDIQSILDQFL